jgi:hypothetical protein
MTEAALLNMIDKVPPSKRQELYDFARFLVDNYATAHDRERIESFESENEMVDFINDIGTTVYAK